MECEKTSPFHCRPRKLRPGPRGDPCHLDRPVGAHVAREPGARSHGAIFPLWEFTPFKSSPKPQYFRFNLSGSSLVFRVLTPACLHCTAQTLPSGFSRAADLLSCCPKASYAPHPYSRKNVYLTSFSVKVNSCLELPAPETSSQLQLRVWFQFVGVSTYLYAITQRDEKL